MLRSLQERQKARSIKLAGFFRSRDATQLTNSNIDTTGTKKLAVPPSSTQHVRVDVGTSITRKLNAV